MAFWGISRLTRRPAFAVVARYGLAVASVATALGTTLILRHYNFPAHFVSHFTLIAIAITFWRAGTGPGVLAYLLSSLGVGILARNHFLLPTFNLEPFLIFYAIFSLLMGWFSTSRRRAERFLIEARNNLELRVAERTRELTRANEDLQNTQAELRRREAYLVEAQRISQTGSWKLNVSSGTVTVSPQIFRIFGVKPDEDASTVEFCLSRNHPEDQRRIQELFEKSRIQKIDYDADYRIVLPDGAIKHLHAVGHPVLNESGDLVEFVGTTMDITERKQREEALQRSEGYLAEAQKLTHTGSWAVRVPQMENAQREAGQGLAVLPRSGWNTSYWSKEMYRIFGLDPDPTPPSYMEVVRRLHPDDARYYTPVVEQAIRDRTDFEADYRLLLPNSLAKYIHVVGHPVANASGDVIELVGTAMDVTEQHEARAALQTAFEQIKAEQTELRRMTDAIASFIYVLRPDGTALYANQTVLDYIGLTLEGG